MQDQWCPELMREQCASENRSESNEKSHLILCQNCLVLYEN